MELETAAEATSPSIPDAQRVGVAEALLALPESDAEISWQQISREVLLVEVSKYRDAIRGIAGRLRELGELSLPAVEDDLLLQNCSTVGGLPTATAGPDDDPDDSEFLQLGDEGIDYTLGNVDDVDPSEWQVPPHCVPIHANVTTFDWTSLYQHCQFDVVMMDPPWQLATANPTRGVALGYSQLTDDHIASLPVPQLQRNGGFLFVWVINAKYKWTLDLFDKWGYRLVDEVVWVKMTVNRRLAKSHGYYLQHAKEVCLVAKCGNPPALEGADGGVGSDIIFSERRGQSQKPEEIYELIEQLVPNGRYLEIFARKNNLRDYWVSIGNEVTGTGLPEEDMRALKELNCIPGAVYGKTGGGGGVGGGGGGAGRSASTGSGAVAATDAGAGPASAAAAPMVRAASTDSMGAVAAGGAGTVRASSCGPATSSGAAPAARARPPGPSFVPAQGNGGGVFAVAQPCPSHPRRPPEVHERQDAAGSAALVQHQSPHVPYRHHPLPPQPSPHQQQKQEDAARPLSRLSLSSRTPRQQGRPPRTEPSAVAAPVRTEGVSRLSAMETAPAEGPIDGQGDGVNELDILGANGGALPGLSNLASAAAAPEYEGSVRNGCKADDGEGEVAGATGLGAVAV
ncbi:hypothetical protein VaNZ11_003254, partial [Volvox africanus]